MDEIIKNENDFGENDCGILKVKKIYEYNNRKPKVFQKGSRFFVISVGEAHLTVRFDSSSEEYLVEKKDVEKPSVF